MSLDFLILPQSFQKNLSEAGNSASARKNDVSVQERNDVKNFKSKTASETQQDKSFDDFMQHLKRKADEASAQNKKSAQASTEKTDTASKPDAANDAFQTQLATTLPADDVLVEDQMLDSIAALNAEIARLINLTSQQANPDGEQSAATLEENSPELIATANETIKAQEEIRNIFALFANLVEQTENSGTGATAEISAILDKIRSLVEAEDGSLITSGYTPEQLTELQKLMQDLVKEQLNQRDLKMLEALAAQWVTLSPPVAKKEQGTAPSDLSSGKPLQNTLQGQSAQKAQESSDAILPEKNHAQTRYDVRYNLESSTLPDDSASQETMDFKSALKSIESKIHQETHTATTSSNNTQTAAQRFLQGALAPLDGLVTATPDTNSSLVPQNGGLGQTASQGQSVLTNIATHAPQAGQPHPATQAVVATIQRAVKEGEDTSIKLQLDPPELGRVEVKMSIGKDNVAKIVLTAEKPETYMMLQRDAQILERALQDSGLNADSGLSFELASQNHDFGGNNNRGGGHDRGGTGAGNGMTADSETIETVMEWRIDPRTGRMHYNVLV